MRLHRFYIENENLEQRLKSGKPMVLPESIRHQLYKVFRLKAGNEIILFDGQGGEYVSELLPIGLTYVKEKRTGLSISSRPVPKVILYQAIIKKDHFELIAEKATEIGVTKIVPVVSERSEKKAINIERIKKIIIEATEQSGRIIFPPISEPISFSESLEKKGNKRIAFHPQGEPFHKWHEENEKKKHMSREETFDIFIGPEGGWSDREVIALKENGVHVVTLGSAILRAETAAIAALTLLLL